jgi:hypothetical protein
MSHFPVSSPVDQPNWDRVGQGQPFVEIRRTTDQSIAANAFADVVFDTLTYETGWHLQNPNQKLWIPAFTTIAIPWPGLWLLGAQGYWQSSASGSRRIMSINLFNAAGALAFSLSEEKTTGQARWIIERTIRLDSAVKSAGLSVFHDAATALLVVADGATRSPNMWARFLEF